MFGLSSRIFRNLPPNLVDASKLFEWNWGVPQFRKQLHVLITRPHEDRHIVT